jgi:small subunit ribosomal protein S17
MSDESTTQTRATRKVREGLVVSDKMDKTVVVEVEDRVKHALYSKVIRRTSKVKVHDEANSAGVGDLVRIMETRPLSATKRWRLIEVVQRAGDHGGADLVTEEAAVSEAIHAAAHPGRHHDDEDGDATAAAEESGADAAVAEKDAE